ncbi:MAG: type II toxin-antitoxin system VapC family toxin [Candidatus Aminicenantes bacterium]|nr:type II toxin-antitoxin system VapC family toxin [Candidatus Aminicenantes bacterium]
MIKNFTFDTDIFSYYLKGDKRINERLKKKLSAGNEFFINPITYYELNRGLLAINSKAKLQRFKKFCDAFGILDLSKEVLDQAAQGYAALRKRGELIEDADILISAVCIVNGLVLITNNRKHFSRIEGLTMENWL